MASVDEAKSLICEMCRNFYAQGWVSGTGGGMSIKVGDRIVMAPSGVQKERMRESDMFVLDARGEVLETPEARPPPYKPPKLSECSPLFMAAYELRDAGAVLHSHSINAVMATLLQPGQPGRGGAVGEFRVTNLEMIKGIAGHGYYDECVVPIIENTARECELTESLRRAIAAYPASNAVLVKRHGVYVWGSSWIQAKTQAECYEYLFEAAVRLHSLGVDVSRPPAAAKAPANGHAAANGVESAAKKPRLGGGAAAVKAVVLDIEGTVAPISFVSDTLFPYARQRLRQHLADTFDSEETQADLALLRKEAGGWPSDREGAIAAAAAFAEDLMARDVKSTGLKAIQGRIWHEGFRSGALRAHLFPDVLPALRAWRDAGVKVYIYSSGSRQAQRDLFAHTDDGDVRDLLFGFFDTTIGAKVETQSYKELALTIGADEPGSLLFATDSEREAAAATAAGWQVALTVRPGNKAVPPAEAAKYRVVHSMADLLT